MHVFILLIIFKFKWGREDLSSCEKSCQFCFVYRLIVLGGGSHHFIVISAHFTLKKKLTNDPRRIHYSLEHK